MSTLARSRQPAAADVAVKGGKLTVELVDGRSLSVPLEWYPRLFHGTRSERRNWRLLGDGYAIEWADLDEHIGIDGLLAGRASGETRKSLQRWLATRKK